MLVLGIETSTRPGSAALCQDANCLAEVPLDHQGLRHAQALPPRVASLLGEHSLTTGDLDLIAISQGPGSFTGLRVGIAFAKTLAWAAGCQLVAVDTFNAIVAHAQLPAECHSLWVAADAHRRELFVRPYSRHDDNPWTPDQDHAIVNAADWCRQLQPHETVVVATPGLLDEVLPSHITNHITSLPAAQSIARLGQLDALAGQLADPVTLEPLYLRKSAAEESLLRRSPGQDQTGD
jgi:tRNA threonylcarbamoyladenosine biosynthesis protein TsaB